MGWLAGLWNTWGGWGGWLPSQLLTNPVAQYNLHIITWERWEASFQLCNGAWWRDLELSEQAGIFVQSKAGRRLLVGCRSSTAGLAQQHARWISPTQQSFCIFQFQELICLVWIWEQLTIPIVLIRNSPWSVTKGRYTFISSEMHNTGILYLNIFTANQGSTYRETWLLVLICNRLIVSQY